MKIIIVENDPYVYKMLKRYFDQHQKDIKTDFCKSCGEMIEALSSDDVPPDMFIVDMMLSDEIDGLEICSFARQQHPEAIIIGMTGYPDKYPFMEIRIRGADDVIFKPFYLKELNEMIKHHLKTLTKWQHYISMFKRKDNEPNR